MPNSDVYHCRVCGLRLDDPPWGFDGKTPLFEYCPCCGVEFGYQDATPIGARKYREGWLSGGAAWDQPTEKLVRWDPAEQLRHVPEAFR
jgi:hypothetical protein